MVRAIEVMLSRFSPISSACIDLLEDWRVGVARSNQRDGVGAQVASLIGREGDATPFTTVTVEDISKQLHS